MKKSRGILVLILTVFMTAFLVFTSAVGLGPTGTGAAKNIKRGLDLSGGVSITYEASKRILQMMRCQIPFISFRNV